MSGTYNRVLIVGRLGRSPELRYTQSGTPVASMNLATNETYTDRDGNKQQRTEWHRVVVWSNQGENVAKYLDKGRLVLVEGQLQNNHWQDSQGNKRVTTEIKANRVVFLPSGSGRKQADQAEAEPAPGVDDNAPF